MTGDCLPRKGEAQNPPVREDNGGPIRDSDGMEAITAPLDSLMWLLSPAGAGVALTSFGLLASGLVGRIFPNLEVSGSARRTRSASRALDAGTRRERIIK